MADIIERLRDYINHVDDIALMNEAADEIARLRRIESAAQNLIAQRGRHNTEIAYRRLVGAVKEE